MYRHMHFIFFWLSSSSSIYFAILKDPVVKYLVAEVANLQLCKWNYPFQTHKHRCQLRLLFCSQNTNNHLSKRDHMGLSKLHFPHVCVIWFNHSLAHAGFLHRFFPHAVHQTDLFLDEKATYGESCQRTPYSHITRQEAELRETLLLYFT